MPARVFAPMARVFKGTFGEPGVHYWQRHDADDPDPIPVIFNSAYAETDNSGLKVTDARPTAWVDKDDLFRIAPERADLDPSLWVNNDDTLVISGKVWRVECCKPDGLNMCELPLYTGKKRP